MHSQSDTILRLWTAARAMFARLRAAVGEATAIAARAFLSVEERKAIRAWLRPLEAMVRKIILVEAAALARLPYGPPASRRPAPKPARKSPSARKTTALRLWPRSVSPAAGPRIRSLGPAILVRDIWRERARLELCQRLARARRNRAPEPQRLARRIEALARILDHPLAAARRLARKLRAARDLAVTLACKKTPRTKLYADPELVLANTCAFAAVRAIDSS